MSKRDLLRRNDQSPPIKNGELVPVASVVQIQQLTVAGPYTGDFQIVSSGRLIVGENPDLGARIIVSPRAILGYNANGINTLSIWASTYTEPNGTQHAPGDAHLGNLDANYLRYDQSTGTLGLYTPQGAGFIVQRDGSLQAGDADGAHMLWNAAEGALQVRYADDVRIALEASGDAFFDGTVNASGGRIYGLMVVDDILRAGDVDGPAVYLGKFSRENGSGDLIETAEIIATDDHNLPWFHVVAGGETLPGYFHLGGTGDYSQYLNYDGSELVTDGTFISAGGRFRADSTGLSFTQASNVYWHVKPSANVFMELVSTGSENYNTLRVTEDAGIAGYFSGGYVGVYGKSTTNQIGVWGFSGSDKAVYGLTDSGVGGTFLATDGGRGVVGSTNSATLGGIVARNTGGGPALVLENSYFNANSQPIYNVARMQLKQVSAPGGASGVGVIYCADSGGKMALYVKFPTGAAQQIAIEP